MRDAGGFGFAAHPFSEGSVRFKRPGMPFGGLDCDALHGIELWSFANDTGERIESLPSLIRFLAMPGRVLDHPPERNMRGWDELCRSVVWSRSAASTRTSSASASALSSRCA